MYSELTGIVLDIGNSSVRAGYSGEDTPKFVFPSVAALYEEQSNDMDIEEISQFPGTVKKKRILIGDKDIRVRRDNMEIVETLYNGAFKNWDAIEKLLQETYTSQLQISPENSPLLMSEPCNPESHQKIDSNQRMKLCELAFEKLKIANFFMCKSAVLSCFASGRSTSLILDSGASGTIAVPVHDGYALRKSIIRYEIGGEIITERILKYVEEKMKTEIKPRYSFVIKLDKDNKKMLPIEQIFPNTHPSYEKFCKIEIARDIKENVCKINIEEKSEGFSEKMEYELPDGTILNFKEERFDFGECLFNNVSKKDSKDIDGYSFKGIHNMVLDSINRSDIDIRKELLSNIIVCGGNTLLQGVVEKLQQKVSETAPQNARIKLIAYPSSIERKFSSWIGGSILSSLGSFQNLWINKGEYDENGCYIIEKKCP